MQLLQRRANEFKPVEHAPLTTLFILLPPLPLLICLLPLQNDQDPHKDGDQIDI